MITARLWCRAGSTFVFALVVANRAKGPTMVPAVLVKPLSGRLKLQPRLEVAS
jgi:hypothetical protein